MLSIYWGAIAHLCAAPTAKPGILPYKPHIYSDYIHTGVEQAAHSRKGACEAEMLTQAQ